MTISVSQPRSDNQPSRPPAVAGDRLTEDDAVRIAATIAATPAETRW